MEKKIFAIGNEKNIRRVVCIKCNVDMQRVELQSYVSGRNKPKIYWNCPICGRKEFE